MASVNGREWFGGSRVYRDKLLDGDPYESRTRVTGMKTRRLNRWTKGPRL